jgi:hypothetical protein
MTRRTLELVGFIAALLLATLAFHAWLASHDEQQRLQATLAAQKQLLDAADVRENDRNAALNSTLAQIAKLKTASLSPEEILRDLQQELSLPQPITLAAQRASASAESKPTPIAKKFAGASSEFLASSSITSSSAPSNANRQGTATAEITVQPAPAAPAPDRSTDLRQILPSAPQAQIPAADLKPLFDFVQDCRSCQAQIAVAKLNAADDAAKIAALTRERDAALTAGKGGSFMRRLRRNAEWLAAGAALGYLAAKR